MASSTRSPLQIIWAVDPFAKEAEVQRNSVWAIKAVTQRQAAMIEPVYVTADPHHQILPRQRDDYVKQAAAEAQDEIDEWVAGARLSRLLPVRTLGPTGSSVRERVEALLDYARKEGADLIATSTRARRGPSRWFFGSFVETLSLLCEIPLLTVNPSWRPTKGTQASFDSILFPTDFSDESHAALMQLLPFAERMRSKLTIFHKVSAGLIVMPEITVGVVGLPEDLQREEMESSRRTAELWVREAEHAGVEADAVIDGRESDSITTAILRQSRKAPGIIALAGESNAIEARLLGSITRQILRESPCPVWVIHPRPTAEEYDLVRHA